MNIQLGHFSESQAGNPQSSIGARIGFQGSGSVGLGVNSFFGVQHFGVHRGKVYSDSNSLQDVSLCCEVQGSPQYPKTLC